ncbi:MAG: right-handed parallel beta-helix repeat-containing protein, partial [Candidatus Aenigmarchaeota archaeon]|nr:right-handed parallel beta-helix repeat-containing protein [Candidatus Aenigmarchaeota archaeon]
PETKFKTDFSSPRAEITSPILLDETAGIINITGYAKEGTKTGSTFKNYTVSYGVGINPTQWYTDGITLMNGGNSAVENETLAVWNATTMVNQMYTIKLIVTNINNEETTDYVVFSLLSKPQIITINSPQNISYDSIEILFKVNLNTDADTQECAFSIDAQENIPMNRNYYDYSLLYTDISKGQHNVVFSCTDKYGIINSTQPLWFSITPETVSGCSVLDMQDTTYYLISDIINSSENICINITAENVTIDGQNHIVDGINTVDTYGIYTNQDDTTIKNCQASNWEHGIHINSSSENSIYGNILKDNALYGIYLLDTESNTIYNNLFNSTSNIGFGGAPYLNSWNTSIKEGNRVYSHGSDIGGNYYTNPTGTGYSDICNDSDEDGFCDSSYTVNTGNVDYLPLSNQCKHIRISSCQNLDIEGMHYKLTSDVSDYGTCFTVDAKNITLNCEGYTINGLPNHIIYGVSNYGIYMSENKAIIKNCVIKNWNYGIYMYDTEQNNILNNNIESNLYSGINSYHSNNNTIEGNNIYNNKYYGINSYHSNNNTIEGNNIFDNMYYGTYFYECKDNEFIENNIFNNKNTGIYFQHSTYSKLRGNNMSGNRYNLGIFGFIDLHFIHDIDTSNTVDEKPIYYWVNQKDKVIPPDAGFVGLINSDNITVKDLTFSENGQGLLLSGTNNSIIKNVILRNNMWGMTFFYSNNNAIENTSIFYNRYDGMIFFYSNNNAIENTSILSNYNNGMYFYSSNSNIIENVDILHNMFASGWYVYNSNNNSIFNSRMHDNYYGIKMDYSNNHSIENTTLSNHGNGIYLRYSNNNTIENVDSLHNKYHGIYLSYSNKNIIENINMSYNVHTGIYLSQYSNNNTIENSDSLYNEDYGLNVFMVQDNFISNCRFQNNGLYGLYIYESQNNQLYNNFFNNTNNIGFYTSYTNKWNTTKQAGPNIIGDPYIGGNYYTNPTGTGYSNTCTDSNKDGICDTYLKLTSNN